MSGPFYAPEGTHPQTWQVTITTVIPGENTDPSDWDFEALLEHIAGHHWAEVNAVQLVPVARPAPELAERVAERERAWVEWENTVCPSTTPEPEPEPEPEPQCHIEYRDRSGMTEAELEPEPAPAPEPKQRIGHMKSMGRREWRLRRHRDDRPGRHVREYLYRSPSYCILAKRIGLGRVTTREGKKVVWLTIPEWNEFWPYYAAQKQAQQAAQASTSRLEVAVRADPQVREQGGEE